MSPQKSSRCSARKSSCQFQRSEIRKSDPIRAQGVDGRQDSAFLLPLSCFIFVLKSKRSGIVFVSVVSGKSVYFFRPPPTSSSYITKTSSI